MTDTETTTPSLSDLIGLYRKGLDEMDRINAERSAQQKRNDELEWQVRQAMTAAGLVNKGDKMTACGLTVFIQEKIRDKYDPARWPSIVEWAVRTGNIHIIQRRLTATKISELIDAGVEMPEGLGVEFYHDLGTRRSRE